MMSATHRYFVNTMAGKRLGSVEVYETKASPYSETKYDITYAGLNQIADWLGVRWTDLKISGRKLTVWIYGRPHATLEREPDYLSDYSGGCPKCSRRGVFIRTALSCPEHGVYGGF